MLKTLIWFILMPLKFFYDLLKDSVLKLVLLFYRLWRQGKKLLLTQSQTDFREMNHPAATWPLIIISLSLIMLVFNLQSRSRIKNFSSTRLLDKLFNQVEEFTVIESALAQAQPVTPDQLLAALETPRLAETELDAQSQVNNGALANTINVESALIRPNIITTVSQARDQVIEYEVQPGDTIGDIAEKHGISTATVLWANHLSEHSIIRPGEKLKILPVSGIMHIVETGDTISEIAKKYDTTIDEILSANELVSEHQLQIKQGLIIPGGKPPTVAPKTTQLASFGQIFSPAPVATPSDSGFIWPTTSRQITQYYWVRHKAIDIGGPTSITIVASQAGRVEYSGWSNGYGYNIVINHGRNVKTRYAHLRELWVEAGDQVAQGQGLGKEGSTGRSTGPHLHFEILINGSPVNPLSYL